MRCGLSFLHLGREVGGCLGRSWGGLDSVNILRRVEGCSCVWPTGETRASRGAVSVSRLSGPGSVFRCGVQGGGGWGGCFPLTAASAWRVDKEGEGVSRFCLASGSGKAWSLSTLIYGMWWN